MDGIRKLKIIFPMVRSTLSAVPGEEPQTDDLNWMLLSRKASYPILMIPFLQAIHMSCLRDKVEHRVLYHPIIGHTEKKSF